MNEKDQENLKDLFERFAESEEAASAADDIQQGEQVFRENPAPQPSEELIADIKAQVTRQLARKKVSFFNRITVKRAAVAAVLVIVGAIGVKLIRPGPDVTTKPVAHIPAEIWNTNDITADDTQLASLIAEIEELEGLELALRLGENGANGYADLDELEMEYVDINGDFWKG